MTVVGGIADVISLRMEQDICRLAQTCTVEVKSVSGAHIYNPGSPLVISINGTPRFTGYIESATKSHAGYIIEGMDKMKLAIDTFITDEVRVTEELDAGYWLDYWLTQVGITTSGPVETGRDIPITLPDEEGWIYISVGDIILECLAYAGGGYTVIVDGDGVAQIQKKTIGASSHSLDCIRFSRSQDDSWYRDRAVVFGTTSGSWVDDEWVSGEVTIVAEVGSGDRTIVLSSSYIQSQAAAEDLANDILNFFDEYLDVKRCLIEGDESIWLGDSASVSEFGYSGMGLITSIETTVDDNGFRQLVSLDEKCGYVWGWGPGLVFAWWEPDDEYVGYSHSEDVGITWDAKVDYDFYTDTSYVGAHVSGYAGNTVWYQYCGADSAPNYARIHTSIDDEVSWQDYELVEILPRTRSQSSSYIGNDGIFRMIWYNERYPRVPDLSNRIYYGTGTLSSGSIAGFTSNLITELSGAPITEVEFTVPSGADDVEHRVPGFIIGGNEINFGRWGGGATQASYALRFTNVNIPKNSTIWSAVVTYKAASSESGTTVKSRIFAEDEDNATQIVSHADYDSRSLTSALTTWSPGAWTNGSLYESPNLKNLVQEVVNRSGWSSGNALQIIHKDNVSTTGARRTFYSYEGGFPATLTVTHSLYVDEFDNEPDTARCDFCWSGDNIYAAWSTDTYDQSSPSRLYFSKSINNGVTWSEPLKVFDTDTLEPFTRCSNVRFERDSEGRLFILMGLGHAISMWRLMISEDDGESWSPKTVVLNQGYRQGTLNIDSQDNIYVAYVSNDDYKVYIQKSTDHAVTFSDPMQITSFTYDWYHDVAISLDDSIHVLTESGYPDRMYHHYSSDGAETFSDAHLIDNSETPYGTGARIFVI